MNKGNVFQRGPLMQEPRPSYRKTGLQAFQLPIWTGGLNLSGPGSDRFCSFVRSSCGLVCLGNGGWILGKDKPLRKIMSRN